MNIGGVNNCESSGEIVNEDNLYSFIGGIAGHNAGNINLCTNYAWLYGRGTTGGIAGLNSNTMFSNTNEGQSGIIYRSLITQLILVRYIYIFMKKTVGQAD